MALALLTLAVYWPVRQHQFINYDDERYITRNEIVQDGLTWPGVQWAFTTMDAANWHPLTWLSHMLDCQFFGLNAGAHHVVSALLHALNTALLFLVFRRMTGDAWRSALVAAFFAIHPLHVESVAWAAERKDVLSTLFGLIAIWSYVRFVERRSIARYLMVIAFLALSLMAKPMLVTLPLVLLLLDYWPLQRLAISHLRSHISHFKPAAGGNSAAARDSNPQSTIHNPHWHQVFADKLPLLALSAASCAVTMLAQTRGGAMDADNILLFSARVINAVLSYAMYLIKTFWPSDLAVLYPHPRSWPAIALMGAIAILLIITAIAFVLRRKRPHLIVGWLWYVGTLVPVIGLVQVGEQARADRYTYFPLIGVFIMFAWSVPVLSQNKRILIAQFLAAAMMFMSLIVVTRHQLQYWSNSEMLFTHTLDVTAKNPTAHVNLGLALIEHNKLDEAAVEFRNALGMDVRFAEAYNGLAYVQARQGEWPKAADEYASAIRCGLNTPEIHLGYGQALAATGNLSKAVEQFQQSLQIRPNYPEALDQLGMALTVLDRKSDAIDAFDRLLALRPNDPVLHNNLARLFLAKPQRSAADVQQAIAHAQRACELSGNRDSRLLDTLAAARAAAQQ